MSLLLRRSINMSLLPERNPVIFIRRTAGQARFCEPQEDITKTFRAINLCDVSGLKQLFLRQIPAIEQSGVF